MSSTFRYRNNYKLSLILILRRILRTINKTRQICSCLTINDNYFVFTQIKITTINRALTNALIKRNRFIKSTSKMRKNKTRMSIKIRIHIIMKKIIKIKIIEQKMSNFILTIYKIIII